MTQPQQRDAAVSVQHTAPADRAGGLDLPIGMGGWSRPEFAPVIRTFARMFNKHAGGGALCVYVDGEPVLDIWAGDAKRGQPWTHDTAAMIFSASKGLTSTVIHRLADRGLLSYDAPVARYWPEFGANGKESITVRDVLDHKSGLSRIDGIAFNAEEALDHELMEQRLAAAPIGLYYGKPAYHAISHGWLLAGLARAITGKSMRELYRTELAEPLGVDGIHLGRPPQGSPTEPAALYAHLDKLVRLPGVKTLLPIGARATNFVPFIRGFANIIYVPGLEMVVADDGTANAPLYDAQWGAASGICTAPAIAKLYSALATDGTVEGREFLSPETVAGFARGLLLQPNRSSGLPMGLHLGYHSLPLPGLFGTFGHIGAGGSAGWADQKRHISMGLAHNRFATLTQTHNVYFGLLWRRILQSLR